MRHWDVPPDFDLERFLAQPLVAHVAAAGPSIRPVWFLWEEDSFWWLTGPWSSLPALIGRHPQVALVVDTCDLASGRVLQVVARGNAELMPYELDRSMRKLRRYLGADPNRWDRQRFAAKGDEVDPETRFVRLVPETLRALDLTYQPR